MAENVDFQVAESVIKINGSELPPDAKPQIAMLRVRDHLSLANTFEIHFINDENRFTDSDLLEIGNEVEILMGYLGETPTPMITGEILGLEPVMAEGGAPTIRVRGMDRLHKLMRDRKTRTFLDMKDSDVASQIADEAGLTSDVEDSGVKHDHIYQDNMSDLAFLRERAERIGFEVWGEEKTLHFKKPAHEDAVEVELEREADLHELEMDVSLMAQPSEVIVRGWDPKTKKKLIGKAKGSDLHDMGGKVLFHEIVEEMGGFVLRVTAKALHSQAEADHLALSVLQDHALEFVTGSGSCRGNPRLRAGRVIELGRIGGNFSGQYYVSATTHTMTPSGYTTSFELRSNSLGKHEREKAAEEEPAPTEETQAIRIEVRDQSDEPVAGLDYRLTLPDGEEREGTLGDDGVIEADNIPKGTVKVKLLPKEEAKAGSGEGAGGAGGGEAKAAKSGSGGETKTGKAPGGKGGGETKTGKAPGSKKSSGETSKKTGPSKKAG